MANSLHFQRQQEPIVRLAKNYLRPHGRFILVEYNIEQGNSAVPYPVSYRQWEELAQRCGFTQTQLVEDAAQPLFERDLFGSELGTKGLKHGRNTDTGP